MTNIKLGIAILAFLVSSTFAVYGQETKKEDPAVQPDAKHENHDRGTTEKRFIAVTGPDGVQHVEITGGEYYFEPNYIVVKANTPVQLTVKKTGYIPHTIVVKAPEAGIDFKVDLKKKPETVSFTPTRTGKYQMFCDEKLLFFKSHKDRGMVGTIEVVE